MPSIWLLCSCNEFFLRGNEPVATDPVVVTETFVQEALPLVDILWVVDDTESMSQELAALGDTAKKFVESLNGLELSWQLGLVTMDTSSGDSGILRGDPWILTPETDDAAAVFEETLNLDTSQTAQEAGFAAAVYALTRPAVDEDNRGFRRDGAALEVVFFSDGDDDGESDDELGRDALAAFLELLSDEAARSGEPAVASAIVGDVPSGCLDEFGQQALPGTAFVQAATETGGIVRSVCDPDLGPIVQQIGETGAVWPTFFPLQATPDPDTIRVEVDGVRADDGWALSIDPSGILFDLAPPADALIVVQYEVASW
jgi:hypothetical protein